MNLIWKMTKASLWGAATLLLFLATLFYIVIGLAAINNITGEELAFKARFFYETHREDLDGLEVLHKARADSANSANQRGLEAKKREALTAKINDGLDRLCRECKLSYDAKELHFHYIFLDDLRVIIDGEAQRKKDSANLASGIFSLTTALILAYLFTSLLRFNSLKFEEYVVLYLIFVPSLLIFGNLATLSWSANRGYDIGNIWVLLTAFIYPFLVYPAVWVYIARHQLKIKRILVLGYGVRLSEKSLS